jgi:hypothetical protein
MRSGQRPGIQTTTISNPDKGEIKSMRNISYYILYIIYPGGVS